MVSNGAVTALNVSMAFDGSEFSVHTWPRHPKLSQPQATQRATRLNSSEDGPLAGLLVSFDVERKTMK